MKMQQGTRCGAAARLVLKNTIAGCFILGFVGASASPADARRRRLIAKCYQQPVEIPNSFRKFERALEKWIAGCVTSRTNNARRERKLVRNNKSARRVWRQLQGRRGRRIKILASFRWKDVRVVGVEFHLPQKPPPPPPPPKKAKPLTEDDVLRCALRRIRKLEAQGIRVYSPGHLPTKLDHLACVAKQAMKPKADTRYAALEPGPKRDRFMRGRIGIADILVQWRTFFRTKAARLNGKACLSRLYSSEGYISKTLDFINAEKGDGEAANRNVLRLGRYVHRRSKRSGDIYRCYNR